jgi:exopolysaccharide production protein ExoZ
VLKSLLFIPHLDPHGALAPVIVPGWTLNYEVFFYVVFAAALAAPIWARALALTAGLVGLCLMGSAAPAPGHAAWAVYSDPIVLEFVAGVWIARAGLPVGRGAAWTAIGAGLAGLLLVEGLRLNPIGVMRLAYWGAPAVLVVTGVVGLERAGAVRRLAALKLLGDASYSIYLVHGLALSLAFKVALAIGLGGAAAAVPSAVFACGVGLACHFTVERPLLRLFRRGARRPIAAAAQIAGSGA